MSSITDNNERKRVSLCCLSPDEIVTTLDLTRRFQGRQIYSWINEKHAEFSQMTNLPQSLREHLIDEYQSPLSSRVTDVQSDGSDALKIAVTYPDDAVVEAVILSDGKGRNTACLSSQIGCAMGCAFCRTGTMGLVRNLSAAEIVEQFIHIRRLQPDTSHIVFMGMGEPLANTEQVIKAIEHLHDPDGINISYRRMTISTCGLVPGINTLRERHLPVRLALSLTGANDSKRDTLMPINTRYPLGEVKEALIAYQKEMKKRITLEYVMMSTVNVSQQDAKDVALFARGLEVIVNLIPYNEAAELPFRTVSDREFESFAHELTRLKVPYTQRLSKGQSINGACGQLAVPLNRP